MLNLAFGAVLGALWALPGIPAYNGAKYRLHQDLRFWQVELGAAWSLLPLSVIWFTEARFQWTYFLGALLGVMAVAMFLSEMALAGKLGSRWALVLRSLYTDADASYRYSDYVPRIDGPILEMFDPNAAEFSLPNALVCAHLSRAAYLPEDDVKAAAKDWRCPVTFIKSEDPDNHVAIVVSSPSAIVVAFRGTDDFKDWLTNFSVWHKQPWGLAWGGVHSGFFSAVDLLWPAVQRAIQEHRKSTQSLWFTGHSLGGAMAVVAAARTSVEATSPKPAGTYTFGQPAVGDAAFCKNFNAELTGKLIRFETPGDEVPKQPPGGLHAGTLLYFDRFDCLHIQPGSFKKFADQLRRDSRGFLGEHKMLEYLRLVEIAYIQQAIQTNEEAVRLNIETTEQWAMAQLNLASLYRKLPSGDPAYNLRRFIQAGEAALRFYTEKTFPSQWAYTLFAIGDAYAHLPDPDLQKAIEAWEATLRVFNQNDSLILWAITQNKLGHAYNHLGGGQMEQNVQKAVLAWEAILGAYTQQEFPEEWATTHVNLGLACLRLPRNQLTLTRSRAHFENALKTFTEQDYPDKHQRTSKYLAEVEAELTASAAR